MTKRIAVFLNLVLITAGAWLCVDLCYTYAISTLKESFHVSGPVTDRPKSALSVYPKSLSAYSAIVKRNLFGAKTTGKISRPVIDLDNLKKTDLALRLVGTVAGLGDDSYAIIESTKDKKQSLYKVGDSIEGAVLKHILRRKVVLEVNGADEVLEMAEDGLQGDSAPWRGSRDYGRRGSVSGPISRAASVRRVTLDRERVQSAFENVNDLMRTVRIRPHFTDGRPDGLSLESVMSGSVFSDMGLQSNDIIVGVNGKRINTVDDCMDVYNSLKTKTSFVLEVKRNGKRQFIYYNMR